MPPTVSDCLICDDVRFERRNVVSIMGVYGPTPYGIIYIQNFENPVNLCFVFWGKPISGKFAFEANLRGPNGKLAATSFPPKVELTLSAEAGGFICVFWFRDAVFPQSADYTVVLLADGVEIYEGRFKISQATAAVKQSF